MSNAASRKSDEKDSQEPRYGLKTIERSVRLWSGVVLMAFVTSHFLNHALGIFGLEVMSQAQEWRGVVWHSTVGTVLLYGAVVTHVLFALWRAVSRRTWRMPPMEALQITLGILIPFLLLGHIVGTRILGDLINVDYGYDNVLRHLWPAKAFFQAFALIIVWCHGIIGLHYAFHVRRWYRSMKGFLAFPAVLIPILALAGFVSSGREAAKLTKPLEEFTPEQIAIQTDAMSTGRLLIFGVLGLALCLILFRIVWNRFTRSITIRYTGHGEVHATPGMTLLEISRANRIPHPSTCGGRGRCSSCRVLVLEGQSEFDPPNDIEKRMLERIKAPSQVRLGCQVRPRSDTSVRVLLESSYASAHTANLGDALDWGSNEEVTVLCADMRGFAAMAQNQLPEDLFLLLSRVIGEMTQAIEARGGVIATVQTDGIMAVFGINQKTRVGSKAAIQAATDILKTVHLINKDIRAALPLPIRVGIGIHSGPVILSRAEGNTGGQRLIVIGETVVAANRLEEVTKEFAADCVISSRTIVAAGLSQPASPERQVHYKNGAKPVLAHAFTDRQQLRSLLGRIDSQTEQQSTQEAV